MKGIDGSRDFYSVDTFLHLKALKRALMPEKASPFISNDIFIRALFAL